VYQCELCERWFCEKHLEPKLAFIKDLYAIWQDPEVRALYFTEIEGKEGKGHPDFEYSQRKFSELKIEERRRNELIKKAFDRMNHYYAELDIPEKPTVREEKRKRIVEKLLEEEAEIDKEKPQIKTKKGEKPNCPICGSTRIMTTAFRKEFEAFECLNCCYTWKETRD
jgi:DNA-directed RNA polymerase subunit M/transcription elongation factor TFIIS